MYPCSGQSNGPGDGLVMRKRIALLRKRYLVDVPSRPFVTKTSQNGPMSKRILGESNGDGVVMRQRIELLR